MVRRFLLARDVAAELGIVADEAATAQAATMSGQYLMPGGASILSDLLFVPFLNLGAYNVGLMVYGTTMSNVPPEVETLASLHESAVVTARANDQEAVASVEGEGATSFPAFHAHQSREAYGSRRMQDPNGSRSASTNEGSSADDDEMFVASDTPRAAVVTLTPPAPQPLPKPMVATRTLKSRRSPVKRGRAVTANNFSVGRYVRSELTGEILHVASDVAEGHVKTVTINWVGPPQGEGGKVREIVSVTCDAAQFASGYLSASVISSEYIVNVRSTPYVPLILPRSPTDMSNHVTNMATMLGATDGYVVPRRSGSSRVIDLSRGRQIMTSFWDGFLPDSQRGLAVRTYLLDIMVQFRVVQPTPMRWTMSPVAEMYMSAWERAKSAIQTVDHELISEELFLERAEETVGVFLESEDEIASLGSSSPVYVCSGRRESDDVHGQSKFPSGVVRPDDAQLTFTTPTRPFRRSAPVSATLSPTTPARGSELPVRRKAFVGRNYGQRATDAEEERKRQMNIASAKRSNARRREAYKELVQTLELAKGVEKMLRLRESELLKKNARLKSFLVEGATG